MKRFESVALVFIVAYVAAFGINFLGGRYILYALYPLSDSFTISTQTNLIATALGILQVLGNIVVAVWMGFESQRHHKAAAVWVMFSLMFGLLSPILFYVILLVESKKGDA